MNRTIRVSSHALGFKATVTVKVYDTREQMIAAAERFSGADLSGSVAVTQGSTRYFEDGTERFLPIIRLHAARLGTEVLSHEMHHATCAIYAATLPEGTDARSILDHTNEPFAYLHGQLLRRLVEALYRHGYYSKTKEVS